MTTTLSPHDGYAVHMPVVCQKLFEALVEVVLPPARGIPPREGVAKTAAELAKADPDTANFLCDFLAIDAGKYIKVDGELYGSSLRPRVLNVLRQMVARQVASDLVSEIEAGDDEK